MNIHSLRYNDLLDPKRAPTPLTLEVDAKTRVCIFSDCHLDTQFDADQCSKFIHIIEESDQVIINGDFWLDKHISFDDFVNSQWSELFPLLKQKHAIYIFGNHDMPQFSDERISLFCDQEGFALKLVAGDEVLHIEHGHLLSSPTTLAVLKIFESHPVALGRATAPLGILSELVLQSSNQHVHRFAQRINTPFKHKRLESVPFEQTFVMGHTHVAERDEKSNYFNLGRTHHGDFSYLTIHDNRIELHSK